MKKTIIGISSISLILSGVYGCGLMDNTRIGPAYELGPVPNHILQAKRPDPMTSLLIEMDDLPGHDDIVFLNRNTAFASGMDGWIWKLDLLSGQARRWVKLPVNPAGLQIAGPENRSLLACASRLGGEQYSEDARVGLYDIDISSKKVIPLLLNVPRAADVSQETIYSVDASEPVKVAELDDSNSRPFSLCNDLAVSRDGKQVYLTEPFSRADAAMGSGAVPEAIGLYPHGRIWIYNRSEKTVQSVIEGFTFADGILLEEKNGSVISIVFTETTKFRMIRAFIGGERAGESEVLQENLPGLADGLERDNQGRIWTGLIKKRSGLINFVHGNPWIKPLLLGLPQAILPVSKDTGLMVFDASGREVLHYSMHDGSRIRDISVAVPHGDRVYLPSFKKDSRGLYSLKISEILEISIR
ncbi:MAG: SMP-30/gluconolaconase/LRE-like region [Spirochaetaceae bacterium]|nr:SMP-30/gluconolaconase/LRE-like region [Spirochaetaceae bacterium]|tara:strand:+ start:3518 stop:4759 length:1242 start_codon:yes stop_codon:yes gene_type:complete